ncbi:hypothetical protein CYMTET_43650 [Cymbomonas tetramitiformis]|uniref:Uncharacterized protein n=1 Tax=Cymbomonas tetramitiformis TaxID=36881 RepID=A0AAE0C314_9CHLO|nr:hypothetical protein CYMTET_43650 [Cymbomonas tetramitiformis]
MSSHTVMSVLKTVDVPKHLSLLTSDAAKRVLRSLIGRMVKSTSFLESELHMTRKAYMTVHGQDRLCKRQEQKEILSALLDEHFGGRTSLKEHCTSIGLCLKILIEAGAAELGRMSYDEEGVSEQLIDKQRNKQTVMRDCTWGALALHVQEKIQAVEQKLGEAELTSVSEATIRRANQKHGMAWFVTTWRTTATMTAMQPGPLSKLDIVKLNA